MPRHTIDYTDQSAAQVDAPHVITGEVTSQIPHYLQRASTPKRGLELPPILRTALLIGVAFIAFALEEKYAPYDWKISTIIGSTDAAIAEKTKEVEITAEGQLRDYVLQVELHNQFQVQQQKIVSESIQNYTTTLYDRAKIGLDHKAKQEQQAMGALIGQVQAENTADMSAGTLSKTAGLIAGIFSPSMGASLRDYGNQLHADARARLEAVALQNHAVQMNDWDLGVPPPDFVSAQLKLIAPLPLPPRPEFKYIKLPPQAVYRDVEYAPAETQGDDDDQTGEE